MRLKNNYILITGGAGFIGSELTRQLASQASQVLVVDNLVNGRREHIEDLLGDRVQLHVEDIRHTERMTALMKGVDVVFHLACLGVRHSIHSPRENHDVNATATLDLLAAARSSGVKRFVYVSSSEVYGTARWAPMTEEHPTFPMTVYGAGKLAGECYTRAYQRTYDYPTVVVRPFNSYGPRCHHEGDSGEVIPKFLLRTLAGKPMVIFGDGTQTRDFTFVSDTARGILLAGFADQAIGQTLNLGQGRETSINDLAQQIARLVGRDTTDVIHEAQRPGDVLRLYADSSRAAELLDFTPAIPLDQGLIQLKQWYEQSGHTAEDLLKQEIVKNWEVTG
ncbi:MAG: GDP-mannose 4,6-dehydratase [Candidatus Competibacter sp.]|nr:GDP-mannose 4,6-dehydratase [Candidatus Competibacter sp.]